MALHFPEWIEYTKRMNSHVKFKFDHEAIRDEYLEHMEDMYEFYVGRGMDPDLAKSAVLEDMGDPDELGRVLNQIHNPVLGWIWRLSRWLVVLLILAVLYPGCVMFGNSAISLFKGYEEIDMAADVYCEVNINEMQQIDHMFLFFDKLELYEDGTAELYFVQMYNPFDKATQYFSDFTAEICDEDGNDYAKSVKTNVGLGCSYLYFNIMQVNDFSQDAGTFILDYDRDGRKLYLEVELEEGVVS